MNIQGIWADPRFDGCGFFIFQTMKTVGVGYFGHTLDGHNLHLTGDGQDITQIPLTITTGTGIPTGSVNKQRAGYLSLMPNPDGTLSATLRLETVKLARVHFSPPPPNGSYTEYHLSCNRVL